MIPIRFGPPSRQMFGVVHPPPGSMDRAHCAVLCNPFGQEAIRSHRVFRVLGERLSREGFHVLRFDYFGTGDSDGDDGEGDLTTWVDDVLRANEEIRRRSGHRKVSWFGLRVGATAVALASARAAVPPDRLVLWDPVHDGPRYLDEIAEAHAREIAAHLGLARKDSLPPVSADGATEALGFPLSAALQAQIRGVSTATVGAARAARIHVVQGGPPEELAQLVARLGAGGRSVAVARVETRIVWASDEAMNTAIVPPDALQALVAAFADGP